MWIRVNGLVMGTAAAFAIACSAPSHALTMKECSTKYRAAQSAGALQGMTWNDFRKAQCGAGAAKFAPSETARPTKRGTAGALPARFTNALFPTAVDRRYANQSAGKARMRTCLDQYHANKASNGNGGLKWIEKGGGYYSECNRRLKSQ